MVKPITEHEIKAATKAILASGKTPNNIGRVQLGRLLGVDANRAYSILLKIRGGPPKAASVSDQERAEYLRQESIRLENVDLKRRLHEETVRQVASKKYQEFIETVDSMRREPPKWTTDIKSSKRKQGTPVAHLSDTHFDEVVLPGEVNDCNAYNRKIGEIRLKRFFSNTIELCDVYLNGIDYPGIVLAMSGDNFSGVIHPELRATNETSICDSIVHWTEQLEAGILALADRFGKVFIPCVVGNHGRTQEKIQFKRSIRDNFDWLLYALMQKDFKNDPRIQFQISESRDNIFNVYNTKILQTHGDQFRGGTGISAEMAPLLLGEARKRERYSAVGDSFDLMIAGHFHRRNSFGRVRLNGSLIGFSDYAAINNLRYQEPCQDFWICDPDYGVTISAPIHVMSKDEKRFWPAQTRAFST